jgi:hypothetical protein
MRPYRVLLRGQGVFVAAQSSADCIISMAGFDLRQAQVIAGEFSRGKAAELTGYETRQARTVLNKLIDLGYLASPTPKSPVRLSFPAEIVDRWFPRLYQPPGAN